jgi:hypothetical protein
VVVLQAAHQLNVDVPPIPDTFELRLPAGHSLNLVVPLFRVIGPEEIARLRDTYSGALRMGNLAAAAAAVDVSAKKRKNKAAAADAITKVVSHGRAPADISELA